MTNKQEKIINQIMKKYIFEDNPSAIVGTELRLRRNGLSQTLNAVCQETCSVSYLSKIEKNEIKPNPELLEEICERLKLTKENIEVINNSKIIFEDIIKATFEGKINVIYDAYLKVQVLKNYRAKLIEFYYYVITNEIKGARTLFGELNKLVGSMLLNDLIMFAYTEALYHEKLNEFQESYTLIIGLEKLTLPFKYLDCLVKEIKVKILYKINSNLFLANIQTFKNLCLEYNAYDKMHVADEMVKKYMARNRYFALLDLDENNEEDHDYLLYEEISSKGEIHNRKGYSPFARLLYLKETHSNDYDKEYERLNEKLTSEEDLVLKITRKKSFSEQYYHDVMEIYYPMALAIGDEIIVTLVENELVRLLQYMKRYIRIVDIYSNGDKRRKALGFFC